MHIPLRTFSTKMNLFIIIFITATLFISCESNSQEILNLQDRILLIEDLDGKEGSLDGNFSDIVSYNIHSGERLIITDDNFYDDHPTYSKELNKIFFESKRIGAHRLTGLTSASNIFALDLKTKIIEQVDSEQLRKRFPHIINDDNNWPVLNHKGNKLMFVVTH